MVDEADREAFLAARNVSRETLQRLDTYAMLLRKWNPAINLVSRTTLADLWSRHFLDSAQLLDRTPNSASNWVDLGSGGGFPGLIVAILAAEAAPHLRVTLVESDARKAAFLLRVAQATETPAEVKIARAETLAPQSADVLSARALAPLDRLLPLAQRHLAEDGIALFPKGAGHAEEIDAALASWAFRVQKHPSITDPSGVILEIGGIARV
ncbi:16S rRNA (guanine(527)-N(7))-methyltransferase RsmG [Maritimibacter sp. 55A14]|uniref:16S rRNA (guanine(527)-N(7))-methyltransferase RsmG n=1 Tax=Maritimibacter sp. 55A14 TaxID=2174844 RepID=UPI000D608BF4|nr:16S rRNA (guanine(527)-N(7))-methyltransferase RsmG [Maritimibacter sp. 55A14]PWE33569.1 16S rRNA (guanine(527)-N(7))-methyltransferase RsmG [Maritimibacter sp. 55A14]